jgi:hypothetical protein
MPHAVASRKRQIACRRFQAPDLTGSAHGVVPQAGSIPLRLGMCFFCSGNAHFTCVRCPRDVIDSVFHPVKRRFLAQPHPALDCKSSMTLHWSSDGIEERRDESVMLSCASSYVRGICHPKCDVCLSLDGRSLERRMHSARNGPCCRTIRRDFRCRKRGHGPVA